jgi:hypothetical protein
VVPWHGRLRTVRTKDHAERVPPVRRIISTPLDGDVALIVPRAPTGMRVTASTLDGRVLGSTVNRILPIRVCGQRRIVLTVSSERPGPFGVSYSAP